MCLEVVNQAIHRELVDSQTLPALKDSLFAYARQTYGHGVPDAAPDSTGLQNKLAQTLTYLFVFLYSDGWESFVDDFRAFCSTQQSENAKGTIFYLRVLDSLHDEIADLLVSRRPNDSRRNTELKDLLRARDVPKIAHSWQDIISRYANRDDNIIEKALQAIGKWVSWIDIALVVNQDTLNLLLPLIGRTPQYGATDKVRDTAITTFSEIVGKKMKPADKVDMIAFLGVREIVSQLASSPPLNEYKSTPQYDTDLAEVVAKLVNTIVSDLVKVLEDRQVPQDVQAKADNLVYEFSPLLLRFFSDEYDEVCSTVIPSLADLLSHLRKLPSLPPPYAEVLPQILNAIILKMRYDETANWGREDEQTDEAEFQELRKKLQLLQKTVAAVDASLYINVLSNLVASTFQTLAARGSSLDWRDLDLALYEMYLFGELSLPNSGITPKSQPSGEATTRLAEMMQSMVQSGKSTTRWRI